MKIIVLCRSSAIPFCRTKPREFRHPSKSRPLYSSWLFVNSKRIKSVWSSLADNALPLNHFLIFIFWHCHWFVGSQSRECVTRTSLCAFGLGCGSIRRFKSYFTPYLIRLEQVSSGVFVLLVLGFCDELDFKIRSCAPKRDYDQFSDIS